MLHKQLTVREKQLRESEAGVEQVGAQSVCVCVCDSVSLHCGGFFCYFKPNKHISEQQMELLAADCSGSL